MKSEKNYQSVTSMNQPINMISQLVFLSLSACTIIPVIMHKFVNVKLCVILTSYLTLFKKKA